MDYIPIDLKQLARRPKKVGTLRGKKVWHLDLKGGLQMIVAANQEAKGGVETFGSGPHPAVARHLAEQREPDISWTELSKADYCAPEHFAGILPGYEALTKAIRAGQGLGD